MFFFHAWAHASLNILHTLQNIKMLRTFSRSLTRLSLQEAFQFAKRDFIERSKQRVSKVKDVQLTMKQKKRLMSLKEQNYVEAGADNKNEQRDERIGK